MGIEPQLPEVGEVVDGKYRIDALIGQGGMGVVFAATHLQMDKRRAIKWLLPRLSRDPNAVRRFLAEAKIASKVDHPNVVAPIDVSVSTGAPYIVMDLLEGQPLNEHLEGRALSLAEAGAIFMPILQGVAAAHDMHIVHRDLKPGNVFLARASTGGFVPKVLDFGIAKVIDAAQTHGTLTDHGAVLGTIQFMPPEQLRDARNVGPAADVYALGVILYQMLSGKLPYEGNLLDLALRIREGRPLRLGAHVKGLPEGFDDIVMRALAAAPEQRYPDVRSFAHALSPYFAGHGAAPRAAGSVRPSARPAAAPARARAAVSEPASTFHPVATDPPKPRTARLWLLAGALFGLATAIGLAAYLLPPQAAPRAEAAAPASAPVAAAAPKAPALQPLALPIDAVSKDAGMPNEPAQGWDDLGHAQPSEAGPRAHEPAPAAPDRETTREPARERAPRSAATRPPAETTPAHTEKPSGRLGIAMDEGDF